MNTSASLQIAMLNWQVASFNFERPGGVLRVLLEEVAHLTALNHNVNIYGQEPTGHHANARILGSYPFAGRYENYLRVLEYFFRARSADILHGANSYIVARRQPRRALMHFMNHHDSVPMIGYEQDKTAYHRAHYALCSQFVYDEFRDAYPEIPEDRCFLLYNSVDVHQFRPVNRRPSQEDGIVRLLFLAAWVPQKGLGEVLELIHQLEQHDLSTRYEWVIAGGTGYWSLAPEEAAKYDAMVEAVATQYDHVVIRGPVDYVDLPRVLGEADIFVAPNLWPEPFALTNLSTMATGTPIIASALGGTTELIEDGRNGYLVPPRDTEALLARVIDLIEDPKKRQKMGLAARQTVVEHFSWEEHTRQLIEIYHIIQSRRNER
jgi:glycosyltransferase involved in cell wall biosynthesis